MADRSRRSFLKKSAGAAGLCLLDPQALVSVLHADAFGHVTGRIEPMPPGTVRLASGIFKEQEEINARYLDSLTVDRLLHSFRLTAGITTTATPYKGWEDPSCELRGHFAGGHFLSAAGAGCGDAGQRRTEKPRQRPCGRHGGVPEEDRNGLFERVSQ